MRVAASAFSQSGTDLTSARPLEAVDHEGLAGDEAGLRGGEEGDELADVSRAADAAAFDPADAMERLDVEMAKTELED